MFSRTLAHLLDSGFPLLPGIAILAEQRVITSAQAERIRQKLNEGVSFSQALREEGMPPLFLSFVSAAEEHGDYGQGCISAKRTITSLRAGDGKSGRP